MKEFVRELKEAMKLALFTFLSGATWAQLWFLYAIVMTYFRFENVQPTPTDSLVAQVVTCYLGFVIAWSCTLGRSWVDRVLKRRSRPPSGGVISEQPSQSISRGTPK